jgi:HEAT repeat protein
MALARTLITGWLIVAATTAGGCSAWRRPSPAKSARRMESPAPDLRVRGINGLADRDFGRRPPYTNRYQQIATTDRDYLVRATAIRALNRARLNQATPIFIAALSDESVKIRLEGAKALVNVPDERAIAPLLAIVNKSDEDKDVRIAAADALRHYKRLDVGRALAATLGEREFGVAWQSLRTLKRLTGADYAYSEPAWLEFFVGPQKPFG